MRLGTRSRTEGGQRRRLRRTVAPLAVAVLTVAASTVVAGGPAGSAEQDGGRFRNRQSDRRQQGAGEADGMPARFVAELDGRLVVVSAETGRVRRHLTASGAGAKQPTVSRDGRTVWFSRVTDTCAAHLASVPVAGGAEKKLPGSGEAGPEGLPLPRPGRAQLAYGRVDCKERHAALIIGDVEGLEGHGQMGLLPVAWDRDGDQLLAVDAGGDGYRLLDVNDGGVIVANRPFNPPDHTAGCRLVVLGFSPDDNDGYVAVRRCGPPGEQARRSLVLLDQTGDYRRTVVRLPRGYEFVDHVAFDATGHSLLFSTAPSEVEVGDATAGSEVTLWLWRDGETRPLARQSGYRHPSWLP